MHSHILDTSMVTIKAVFNNTWQTDSSFGSTEVINSACISVNLKIRDDDFHIA